MHKYTFTDSKLAMTLCAKLTSKHFSWIDIRYIFERGEHTIETKCSIPEAELQPGPRAAYVYSTGALAMYVDGFVDGWKAR